MKFFKNLVSRLLSKDKNSILDQRDEPRDYGLKNDHNPHEQYDTLLKDFLKLVFKKSGFSTSGSTFYKKEEGFTKVFQVQKSRGNYSDLVKFTFNIALFDPLTCEVFDQEIPKKPRIYNCVIEKRIGSLLPGGQDYWYSIDKYTQLDALINEIMSHLDKFVFPYLDKFASLEDLTVAYATEKDPFLLQKPIDLFAAYHYSRSGRGHLAKPIFEKYYEKWHNDPLWKTRLENLLNEMNGKT